MSYSYYIVKRDTKPDDPSHLRSALLKNQVSIVAHKHPQAVHPFIMLEDTLRYAYQLPHPGKESEYAIIRCHEKLSADEKTVELSIVSTYEVPADCHSFGTATYSEPIKLTISQAQLTNLEMLEKKQDVVNPAFRVQAIGDTSKYKPSEEKFNLSQDARAAVLKLLQDEIKRLNNAYPEATAVVKTRLAGLQTALDFFNSKHVISYQEAFFYLGHAEKSQVGVNQNQVEKKLRSLFDGIFGMASSAGEGRIRHVISTLKSELALREAKKSPLYHKLG